MMNTRSPYDPMSTELGNGITNGYTSNGYDTLSRLVLDGNYIDGSWELSVYVEDLGDEVKVRVLGGLTLGGLMHRIVEAVHLKQSWSDHAIWWSDRNIWLLHNRTTLDQYGIQSDAKLMFRRMHGNLRIILPSLISVVLRVNYSARVFNVVRNICKELNIRHPEELSLTVPITRMHLKSNLPLPNLRHGIKRPSNPVLPMRPSTGALKNKFPSTTDSPYCPPGMDGVPHSPYNTLHSVASTMRRLQSENSLDRERLDLAQFADCSFSRPVKSVFAEELLHKPKNLIQKARLNSGWLDSSRSLLEHGIEPPQIGDDEAIPVLYLCFKYYAFYDINSKYDAVRIHQLYEQARWSVLSGLLDCTEDEMCVFAAYQLQAQLQSNPMLRQPNYLSGFGEAASPNYYPTLGAASTIGTGFTSGYHHSPELLREHSIFSSSPYYPMDGTMKSSSMARLPGATSPFPGASVVDGTFHRQVSDPGHPVDEVDELLAELEQSCGVNDETTSTATYGNMGGASGTLRSNRRGKDVPDTAEIPTLEDSLRVFRERTLLLRRYKIYWVRIREACLFLYKSQQETDLPLFTYSLRDCTITPDVSTAMHKYILKLIVLTETNQPTTNNTPGNGFHSTASKTTAQNVPVNRDEIWLRFEAAEQYARWLAACRLGAKGKTLASRVAYEKEVETIVEMLRLQVPGPSPAITGDESVRQLGDLAEFCAERIIRKAKSRDYLRRRITEAHVNIRDLSLLEAKCKYIQAWQRLNHFGRSYFTVIFDRSSNLGISTGASGFFSAPTDDLIAICQGRIEIVSPNTGDVLRAWNTTDLRSWNVNWDAGKVILDFRSGQVTFRPLCTNCKTVVEFIGGYVFLSQRTPEKSQECNEKLFHRLTGAND